MFSLRIIWSLKFIKSRSQWFEIIRNQINLSSLCNFNWRSNKSILSIFISMMRYWGDCLWKLCYVVLMSSLFQRRIFDLNQDIFWRLNILLSRLNSLWVCVFKDLNWWRQLSFWKYISFCLLWFWNIIKILFWNWICERNGVEFILGCSKTKWFR